MTIQRTPRPGSPARNLSLPSEREQPSATTGATQPQPETSPDSLQDWPSNPLLFLKDLIDMSLRGIGIADPYGIIRLTNSVCRNIYGLQSEEIIGHHFREFYADAEALNQMLAQARAEGQVNNYPILARHSSGWPVPIEVNLHRVHDASGRLLGSIAMIHDKRHPEELVRQLQQQELALVNLNRNLELANLELARANRLKDEFLATTSHELRTPLNAILGFLRLVIDQMCDNPAEEAQFIQNAYESAKNLLNLINELLDTAKIEAGKVDLELVQVDIGKIFDEIRKLTQLQAAQKELRLSFRPPRLMVRADPEKLQQVLLNLVSNAIKFTHEGEIRVIARAFQAKGHVRFEIRDTGIGIPAEIQRDLFQKFVQGNGSTTRQYGGSGLGLAICKNLVEFMGGRIWLTSPGPGLGTTVYFTLPLISATPLHWRHLEDRERGLEIHGPADGPLVLVVEDEPKVVEVMTRILNKHGYRTAYAVTADDGWEGAQRLAPSLITVDMGLPVRPQATLRTGLDLCAALQEDPETTGIPLVLVTGHDTSLNEPIKNQPPVLTKPFRVRELVEKVGELLREKDLCQLWR